MEEWISSQGGKGGHFIPPYPIRIRKITIKHHKLVRLIV